MRPTGTTCEADDGAPGPGIPPGASKPGEGGNQVHTAGIVHRSGQRPDLGGGVDDSQPVAEPLDAGARCEDGSFEGVCDRFAVCEGPCHGRQQPVDGIREFGSHVGKQKGPGAIGVLRLAGLEAGLAEESSLLIAGDTADRCAGLQRASVAGHAEAARRGSDLG